MKINLNVESMDWDSPEPTPKSVAAPPKLSNKIETSGPYPAFSSSLSTGSPLANRLKNGTAIPAKVPIDMSYVVNKATPSSPPPPQPPPPNKDLPPVSKSFSIVVDTNIFIHDLSFVRRLVQQGCSNGKALFFIIHL